MFESEELKISQKSPSVHDHATPIISLLNSDGETNQSLLPLDNISICNSTPIINDIVAPLMLDALVDIVSGKLDIAVVTGTKLDETFPKNQFLIEGFTPSFRLDRNGHGGGVMIYVRENIPCKILNKHGTSENFEGIYLDVNIRKRKWLLFGVIIQVKTLFQFF